MNNISAVIITHNEEANIEACILALQKVSNDIVVVDSESTDQTVAIAQKLGAKTVVMKWQGYADTKNSLNEHAAFDWIISIDADEILSDKLTTTLNNLQLDKQKVYALDIQTNFCGQWINHSGWYPEWKIRLFNRAYTKWVGNFVHEHLNYQANNLEVERLHGKLLHYSYKTHEEHLVRIERYAQLSALELQAEGKRSNFFKLWISPFARFFRTFFLKRGILDGKSGWIISIRNAKLVHLKYKLLHELNK